MSAVHPLLISHPDNQLSSGAFSRFRQLGASSSGGALSITNPANAVGGTMQTNPTTALTFGQQIGPTATIVTGTAALAAHQQSIQQAQRTR